MASKNAKALDQWTRSSFKQFNTELELLYADLESPEEVTEVGLAIKLDLVSEGGELIANLLNEGNTDEGFDSGFELLGNVGFFMAACRRHEIHPNSGTKSAQYLKDASALSLQLGASLGVVPRFASAHLETHNRAIGGQYKCFTQLPAEELFIEYNTRGVFSLIRASEALLNCLPLGVSHPIAFDLLVAARRALEEVVDNNNRLYEELNTRDFFYHVRPYYKPHTVGLREYRGANAGDFAGINAIDLLLGLCRADDAYYSQLLVDKFLFMRPEDQLVLRDCMRRQSLMDEFLLDLEKETNQGQYFRKNLAEFLAVCKAHGQTALQHHTMLINKFIEQPAAQAGLKDKSDITASGPPLDIMLRGLKMLCDLRSAANVDGLETRYDDIAQLKQFLNQTV